MIIIIFYFIIIFFYEFVGQVGLSLPFPCPKADRHVDSRLCSGILPWHLSLCSRMHFHAHTRNPVGIASSFSTFPVSIAVWPALVATEIDGIFIILFFQRWQFVHKIFPFPRKKKETLLLTTTKRLLHSLNPTEYMT